MSAQSIFPFPEPPAVNLAVSTAAHPVVSQSMDSIIAQSMAVQDVPGAPPSVQTMGGSVGFKESQPLPTFHQPESAPLVELQEEEKIPVEVEGYLQKLEQAGDIKLPEPITHDGDVLLANSEAQIIKEKIVLPMTQTAVTQGKATPVTDSARWLAEWCLRLIKMMKDGVKYAEEPTNS